jgi:hypothetical protein
MLGLMRRLRDGIQHGALAEVRRDFESRWHAASAPAASD